RLPLVLNLRSQQIVEFCNTHNLQIVVASNKASKDYSEVNWTVPTALIVGSEANGVDPIIVKAAKEYVLIPMTKPVESLNVSTATAVLLYEALKQRTGKSS
ncbi:MAG: TrmH family RNA methyltransferase, partial [Blastocatellia bacterium]